MAGSHAGMNEHEVPVTHRHREAREVPVTTLEPSLMDVLLDEYGGDYHQARAEFLRRQKSDPSSSAPGTYRLR